MTDERRKYIRIKNENAKVICKIMGVKGEYMAPVLDLGAGGLRLPLKEKILPGTLLELNIFLPQNKEPFFGLAKVAWQNSGIKKSETGRPYYETGVEFIRVGFENRKHIIKYINKCLRQE